MKKEIMSNRDKVMTIARQAVKIARLEQENTMLKTQVRNSEQWEKEFKLDLRVRQTTSFDRIATRILNYNRAGIINFDNL